MFSVDAEGVCVYINHVEKMSECRLQTLQIKGDLGLPRSASMQRSSLTCGQDHSTAGGGLMEESL